MENEIYHLKLEDILPNRYQPREALDENSLKELADSIKQHGIIQPIIVRKINDKYEIVDGYRRYKAAIIAGLTKIPTLIREYDEKESVKVALIDNLQRKDLSPIEEAKAYKHLLELDGMTQEQLANNLGKSQSAVANKIRLLNLPFEIQESLLKNEISERHARSLLTVKDTKTQIDLLAKIIEKRMSVRELDSEIKNMSNMFIPEEYTNNQSNVSSFDNQNQGNQFIPNFDVPVNTSGSFNNDSSFPAQNSFNNPLPSMNEPSLPMNNTFIVPPQDQGGNSFINNNPTASFINPLPAREEPLPDTSLGTQNNLSNNPFLTDANYKPPMTSTVNSNGDFNPFSNIRLNSNSQQQMNDTNINNVPPMNDPNIGNEPSLYGYPTPPETDFTNLAPVDSFEINDNNPNFNIDDYKLPGMDYSEDNDDLNNVNLTNNNNQPIDINDYQYIENNPVYESVDNPHLISSVDEIIAVLQQTLNTIKKSKMRVETEEIDYDDMYQIVIKIDKKGSL